ncbi:MAG: DMT family transporter [Opitutaceae bacterium]|nr:DMT family transporter [Opitutaceae bacterium]
MRNPAHTKAVGQLLLAALCWSLGGLLIKWVEWPPLAVAGGRGFIAAAFLVITHRRLRFTWSPIQLGAAAAYAACTISFVAATKLTTAANAILLQYTAPVWVALLGAWFLREHATRADWFAIAATFAGMALFFADGLQFTGVLGNVIAVISGLCFAGMAVLMRKQKEGSVVESIILGNLIAGIVGSPFIIRAPALSPDGWMALTVLGTVQLGLSYLFYSRAIKHVTALEAVLLPVIEPILNPVWVMLFLGEKPGRFALLGGVIVLGAVTWRALHSIRRLRLVPASSTEDAAT